MNVRSYSPRPGVDLELKLAGDEPEVVAVVLHKDPAAALHGDKVVIGSVFPLGNGTVDRAFRKHTRRLAKLIDVIAAEGELRALQSAARVRVRGDERSPAARLLEAFQERAAAVSSCRS